MSLVIEALRRVEKTDARTGSIGAAVASYRPVSRPRSSAVPLLLGLVTGGALVFLLGAPGRNGVSGGAPSGDAAGATPKTSAFKGAAGLPPPLIVEPVVRAPEPRTLPGTGGVSGLGLASATPAPRTESSFRPAGVTPAYVLQAISERDSRPIAIINDQLVMEGDKLGSIRVLRIGYDSVEVLLENGKSDTVRFAPPPPPSSEASPSPPPRH